MKISGSTERGNHPLDFFSFNNKLAIEDHETDHSGSDLLYLYHTKENVTITWLQTTVSYIRHIGRAANIQVGYFSMSRLKIAHNSSQPLYKISSSSSTKGMLGRKLFLFSFVFSCSFQRVVGRFGYQWRNHRHSKEGQPPFTRDSNLSYSTFFSLSRLSSVDTEQIWWYIIVAENGRYNIYQNYIMEVFFFPSLFQAKGAQMCVTISIREASQNMAANTSCMGHRSLYHILYWVATPRWERVSLHNVAHEYFEGQT